MEEGTRRSVPSARDLLFERASRDVAPTASAATITERVDVDKASPRTITRLADIEREANANAYRAAKIKARPPPP